MSSDMAQLTNHCDHAEIEKTFQLLEEGKKKIKFDEHYKDVIMVLGNTGSGKSTLVQWIAGDKNHTLTSTEVNGDSGEFIIEDDSKRIGSTIFSKTTFPEQVINNGTAYYDSPGFSDTRSTANDIANNYFIKKITNHCSHLKIVLVVNYSSVRIGSDRADFVTLLRRTTSLIKNISKYLDSFGLIVTKVENITKKKEDGNSFTIPDEKMIGNIAEYLKSVKKDLNEILDVTEEEKVFRNNAITMLDIFLENDTYPRIGIFRRPDERGPISDIKNLKEGKQRIEKLIKDLKFTEKCDDDFGYAISDTSKNDVHALVDTIHDKVWALLTEILEKVIKQNEDVFTGVNTKLNSFLGNIETFELDEKFALDFDTAIRAVERAVSRLTTHSKTALKVTDLPEEIRNTIVEGLDFNTCQETITNISAQVEYYEFLEIVSSKDLNTKPWPILFKQLETFLTGKNEESNRVLTALLLKISDLNEKTMEKIGESLEEFYRKKVLSTGIEEIISELNQARRMVSDWIGTDSTQLAEKISNCELAPSSILSDAFSFSKNAKYFARLNVSENIKIDDSNSKWKKPLRSTEKYLADLTEFMGFLEYVYYDLSQYDVQKNNVAYLRNMGKEVETQGMYIDANNFKQFVKLFIGSKTLEELDVTNFHLDLLNLVLHKTLITGVKFDRPEPGKLVISGDFVKISDVVHIFQDGSVTDIDIFALNTVFIDTDIRFSDGRLSIIAPKCEIIGKRLINLDGAPGSPHSPPNAAEGSAPGDDGSTGAPGLPGSPGGNFLGIVCKVIGGENLTISACGGEGGPGQNGGNGKDGKDGKAGSENSSEKVLKNQRKLIFLFYNSYTYNYVAIGEKGDIGGKGGDGGIGGLGGKDGQVLILPLVGDLKLPIVKLGDGLQGKGGYGGIGGLDGRNGNKRKAQKDYVYALFFMVSKIWENLAEIPEDSNTIRSRQMDGLNGTNGDHLQQPIQKTEFQSIANTVRCYKNHLLENISDNFKTTALLEFLTKLDSNENIQNSYDTSTLVLEFLDLEKMYKGGNLKILPFYESLFKTIREHGKNPTKSTAFSHVYAATLSRIITLNRKTSEYLIISLEKYLQTARQNIDDLRDLKDKDKKLKVINHYRDAHKTDIDSKIAEALQFIESQLMPEMQDICKEVESLTEEFISDLKTDANAKNNMVMSGTPMWFNFMKLMGDVVSCFGNLGFAVGSVINIGCQVAESTVREYTRSFKTLSIRDSILGITNALHNFSKESDSKKKFKGKKQSKSGKKTQNGGTFVSNLQKGAKALVSSVNGIIENQENRYIEQAKDVMEELEQNEPPVHEELIQALENSIQEWDLCVKSLNDRSKVDLDVTRHQLKSQLKSLKMSIKRETTGLPVERKMLQFVHKLEDAMTTMIRIYGRIQSYQHHKELAQYIADINSSEELDLDDALVAKLDLTIHSNLILEQHRSAVNAFTQHVFPFASYYLKDFTLVKSVLPPEGSFENLVDSAMAEVKDLHSKVIEYKSLITSHDKFLCTGWFNRDYESARPFFVWKNSENQSEICKLLSGQNVVLKADILESVLDKDAVKFNKIGINFHSDDPELTSDIRKKLNGFTVSATHLGNSYYKFGNKIYVISSGHQKITFSFEKDKDDEPVHKNVVYGKIGSGDLMLSPYAMWEFQLAPNSSENQFVELETYKDKVDLELVGYGSYLTKGASMSDLDVESHYQVVQTL